MSTKSKSSNFLGKWGIAILAGVVGLGMLACIIGGLILGGAFLFQNRSSAQKPADQPSNSAPVAGATRAVAPAQRAADPAQATDPAQQADPAQDASSLQVADPVQVVEPAQVQEPAPAAAPADGAAPDQPDAPRPDDPKSALVYGMQGIVEVKTRDGGWQTAQEGQTLQAGQSLRTGAVSSANLAFYDGSLVQLGAQAELGVDSLDANTDGARLVQLTQLSGESQHNVAKSGDPASKYEVNTPAGNGSAQGTVFTVVVIPDQFSRFWVDDGAINVFHRDTTVKVVAGQVTTVPEWDVPSQPYFRVTGEGEVTQTGSAWIVAGQAFITGATTVIWGNPQVGDWVRVEGHLLTNGSRFADHIILLRRAVENRFDFSGLVESINSKSWTISGRTVQVDQNTVLEPGLVVGDKVQVTGRVAPDGVLWAMQISLLDEAAQRFHFTGVVESLGANSWTVSGINLTVNVTTTIIGEINVGDVVIVDGRIMPPNEWVASSIRKANPDEYHFDFTGVLQSMSPWVVSGIGFDTADWTEIEDGLLVGDRVRVTGIVQDGGTWVAETIEKLDLLPRLRFSFIGPVLSIQPWVIGGVPVSVTPETRIKGDILLGEMVKVTGWLMEDGTWEAIEIKHTGWHRGWGCMDIRAVVQTVSPTELVLLDGTPIDLTGVLVTGEIREASVVLYQVCIDRHSLKHSVVYIIFVYQLDEMPVIIVHTGAAVPAGCKVSKNGHVKCSKNSKKQP